MRMIHEILPAGLIIPLEAEKDAFVVLLSNEADYMMRVTLVERHANLHVLIFECLEFRYQLSD